MKYTIWHIDDSRQSYIDGIRKSVANWDEVDIECVNGSDKESVLKNVERHNVPGLLEENLTDGERGVWLTFLNTIQWCVDNDSPIVTFEDDALLHSNFVPAFENRIEQAPMNTSFFSLFIPRDHDHWNQYEYEIDDNGHIVNNKKKRHSPLYRKLNDAVFTAWQKYGGVSMLWTPEGAADCLQLIQDNIHSQWDEYVYCQSRLGNLTGVTSNPALEDLVFITGDVPSMIHD